MVQYHGTKKSTRPMHLGKLQCMHVARPLRDHVLTWKSVVTCRVKFPHQYTIIFFHHYLEFFQVAWLLHSSD